MLAQGRKGGAGNTGTSPLPAKSSILDGDLACYKLNAACYWPLDGGVTKYFLGVGFIEFLDVLKFQKCRKNRE